MFSNNKPKDAIAPGFASDGHSNGNGNSNGNGSSHSESASSASAQSDSPAQAYTSPSTPLITPAPSPAPAKRPVQKGGAPSLISADLTVTGKLTSEGDIHIEGVVDGDVRCNALVIGEKASVHGEVVAEEVNVRGRVEGSVRARKVMLAASCHVEGNILHETFAVETGAFFEGNCRHSSDPTAEDAVMPKPKDYSRRPALSATPSASSTMDADHDDHPSQSETAAY